MTAPMRATIIPADGFCSVDGVGFNGVDMTSVAPEVHAVQWYGTYGEIEVQDPLKGKMITNEEITNLDDFQGVLDSYWAVREAYDESQVVDPEILEEQTVIEV